MRYSTETISYAKNKKLVLEIAHINFLAHNTNP